MRLKPTPGSALLWAAGFLLMFAAPWANAAPLSITVDTATKISASQATYACTTNAQTTFEEVLSGACIPRLMTQGELSEGFSKDVSWLRLSLRNNTHEAIRRWVSVGHPRLEEVSLFAPEENGQWSRTEAGTLTPMDKRNDYAREFGVLPVNIDANSTTTLWLRIASRTSIDLNTILWKPSEYSKNMYQWNLGIGIALGGLMVVSILSILIYLVLKARAYLFFGLAFLGALLTELYRNGLLQRYLWPAEWPLLAEANTIFSIWTVGNFVLFVYSTLPELRSYILRHYLFAGLISVTLLGQLWALFVDHGNGTQLWNITLNAALFVGMVLTFQAWRTGSRRAGLILLSFGLLTLIQIVRLGVTLGILPFYQGELLAALWALMMAAPLFLLSTFEHSRDLESRLIKIEAENSAKLNFLSRMSHELRTPLNSILGYAELLERHSSRVTMEEATHAIKQSGKYLLGMIDEILDHTRSITGKMKLESAPLELRAFLAEIQRNTKVMCQTSGNHFTLEVEGALPDAILADERRLRQVLDNLLTNANRYTQHGKITLGCKITAPTSSAVELVFSVTDNGIGIPPEDQEKIFLPFSRGSHVANTGIEGSGIGLAVVQQLVKLMGSKIQLESTQSEGSRFSFVLHCPRASLPQEIGMDTGGYTALKHAIRILLVDDDVTNLHVMTALLADQAFDVITARSGNDARKFLGQKIDLVLTDQFMANGDGWQVLQDWNRYRIPVFLLSAAPPQRPEKFPAEINFTNILLKPANADYLLTAIMDELGIPARRAPGRKPTAPKNPASPLPTAESLAPLLPMIEAGAVTDITEWLQQFTQEHPEYSVYADQIKQATLNLDFEQLHQLVTQPGS